MADDNEPRLRARTGTLHHVEIYVADLERSATFWAFVLGELGYVVYQRWESGVSFRLGATYLVLVQVDEAHRTPGFHRRRVGLNHLAFHAASREQVDALTAALPEHGGRVLYEDRHPYAGGHEHYAVFFEDPDRIKVEVVAPPVENGAGRVRVFIASSLDGFIAGPNDELDWLPGADGSPVDMEDTYTPFMAGVGALLMGRRTYDTVRGMGDDWPYGETPVLVATTRPLDEAPSTVEVVAGEVSDLVAHAKQVAGRRDVYLDGGALIRAALDAGVVDDLTVSVVPKVLGAGRALFAGSSRQHAFELLGAREIGAGMVELRYRATSPSA